MDVFKQTTQILQQINVNPVFGAGIQTHNLLNISLHPQPLDQGFHHIVDKFVCRVAEPIVRRTKLENRQFAQQKLELLDLHTFFFLARQSHVSQLFQGNYLQLFC